MRINSASAYRQKSPDLSILFTFCEQEKYLMFSFREYLIGGWSSVRLLISVVRILPCGRAYVRLPSGDGVNGSFHLIKVCVLWNASLCASIERGMYRKPVVSVSNDEDR